MKKFLSVFLIGALVSSGLQAADINILTHPDHPNILYKEGINLDSEKRDCVMGWDLNSVVFTKDTSARNIMRMLGSLRQQEGLWYVLWAGTRFGALWTEKKTLKRANDPRGFVWDAMFTDLAGRGSTAAEQAENKKLANHLRTFSQQANSLHEGVADLLHGLNAAGHRNAVLSNMGQGLLDTQIEKSFPADQREGLSDRDKYVLGFLEDSDHKVIASKDNNWLHKPDAKSYQTFLDKNPDKNGQKIFIDDKRSNCEAALQHGFDIAIVCRDQGALPTLLHDLNVTGA